jgi:hypothetical protein
VAYGPAGLLLSIERTNCKINIPKKQPIGGIGYPSPGVYDGNKGSPDDDAHRQVKDISTQNKCFEFFQHGIFSLFSRLISQSCSHMVKIDNFFVAYDMRSAFEAKSLFDQTINR